MHKQMTRELLALTLESHFGHIHGDKSVEVVIEGDTVVVSFATQRACHDLYFYMKRLPELFKSSELDNWVKDGRYYVSHQLNSIQKNLLGEAT